MYLILWIILCTLAFIGAIEIYNSVFYGNNPRKKTLRGTLVINLENSIAGMKEQLEYYLSWIQWNGDHQRILFIYSGHDDDSAKEMFERYLGGMEQVRLIDRSHISADIF